METSVILEFRIMTEVVCSMRKSGMALSEEGKKQKKNEKKLDVRTLNLEYFKVLHLHTLVLQFFGNICVCVFLFFFQNGVYS